MLAYHQWTVPNKSFCSHVALDQAAQVCCDCCQSGMHMPLCFESCQQPSCMQVWNFSTGACLKELAAVSSQEITAIICLTVRACLLAPARQHLTRPLHCLHPFYLYFFRLSSLHADITASQLSCSVSILLKSRGIALCACDPCTQKVLRPSLALQMGLSG